MTAKVILTSYSCIHVYIKGDYLQASVNSEVGALVSSSNIVSFKLCCRSVVGHLVTCVPSIVPAHTHTHARVHTHTHTHTHTHRVQIIVTAKWQNIHRLKTVAYHTHNHTQSSGWKGIYTFTHIKTVEPLKTGPFACRSTSASTFT